MPTYDFQCVECGYTEDRMMKYEERDTEYSCPHCDSSMKRVWIKAPGINQIGPDGSDSAIKAVQQECRERFIKKEIDDVRHKHGDAIDDAIKGGAIKRIKDVKDNI